MNQTTVASFTANRNGNEPAQGVRFVDERDGDDNGRGIPKLELRPELLVLTAVFWIPARMSQVAAKAPRSDVLVKVKTAMEGLQI